MLRMQEQAAQFHARMLWRVLCDSPLPVRLVVALRLVFRAKTPTAAAGVTR
jgi:hypothetical protein